MKCKITYNTIGWIKNVAESCETRKQCATARRLVRNALIALRHEKHSSAKKDLLLQVSCNLSRLRIGIPHEFEK